MSQDPGVGLSQVDDEQPERASRPNGGPAGALTGAAAAELPMPVDDLISLMSERLLGDKSLRSQLDNYDVVPNDVRVALEDHIGDLPGKTHGTRNAWIDARASQASAEELAARQPEAETAAPSRSLLQRAFLRLNRWIGWPRVRAPDLISQPPRGRKELRAAVEQSNANVKKSVADWEEAAYSNWALPLITALINQRDEPSFRSRLPGQAGKGLTEVFHADYEVLTPAAKKLFGLLRAMGGGSIGLCGLRGCGKSTLIHSICATSSGQGQLGPSFGFWVSAPVRYDAREFVLYLFSRLCEEILGQENGQPREAEPGLWRRQPIGRWAGWAVALLAMAAGVISVAVGISGVSLARLTESAGFRISLGCILFGAGTSVLWLLRRGQVAEQRYRTSTVRPSYLRVGELSRTYEMDGRVANKLLKDASNWLREIRYQSTFTSGWSGSLTAPIAQASLSESNQSAEQQRALPDLVAGFRELLRRVHAAGPQVFIGIDELDKMDDQDAQQFLNEIKVVFGIEGCFYLVSVSENAMSSFERRGLPFRDAFDSAFDEVIRFDQFTFALSRALLGRRTVMPMPFVALCHCVSGGLPRDLIRAARTLYQLNTTPGTTDVLDSLVSSLVIEDVRAKAAAIAVDLAQVDCEPEATKLEYWLQPIGGWLPKAQSDPAAELGKVLLARCRGLWREAPGWSRIPGRDDARAGRERLTSLGLEANAYCYFAATLLQFFQLSDHDLRTAAEPGSGNASFELLARSRQLFGQSPLLAWQMISHFRHAHHLTCLKQPDPCWLEPLPSGGS